jgi:hypothetical protein
MGEVLGRLDVVNDSLNDVREWQSEHTVEHAVSRVTNRAAALEYREGE